jgi:hypothetical protein
MVQMLVIAASPTWLAAAAAQSSNVVLNANACQVAWPTVKTGCGVADTVAGADIKTIQV